MMMDKPESMALILRFIEACARADGNRLNAWRLRSLSSYSSSSSSPSTPPTGGGGRIVGRIDGATTITTT